MSAWSRILFQINWQWLFLFAYIIIFIAILRKSNRQLKDLMRFLDLNSGNAVECIKRIKKYIKYNPFSQASSLLRAMAIPILLKENDQELNSFVRKIRCVDISKEASDVLAWDLFLLKELNCREEYDLLKCKAEKRKSFFAEDLRELLICESIAAIRLEQLSLEGRPVIQTAIILYYQGQELWKNEHFAQAKTRFEASQKAMPAIKRVLDARGYSL